MRDIVDNSCLRLLDVVITETFCLNVVFRGDCDNISCNVAVEKWNVVMAGICCGRILIRTTKKKEGRCFAKHIGLSRYTVFSVISVKREINN